MTARSPVVGSTAHAFGTNAAFSCSVFIGLVFLASGSSKLNASYEFLHTVAGYDLLGWRSTIAVAATLPWFELVIGAALVIGLFAEVATIFSVLLSICFVVACTSAWHRNLDIPCGCFGSSDPISAATVLRSIGMLGICLLAAVLSTIALGILLRGLVVLVWTAQQLYPATALGWTNPPVVLPGGARISTASLTLIGATVAVYLGLYVFLRFTSFGIRMRAGRRRIHWKHHG